MKPVRSILAAVNVQRGARAALSTASMLAQAANARLHVVHAIELDSSGFPARAPTFSALVQRSERALRTALRRWVSGPAPASVEAIVYSPHRSIASRASQVRADLIVIGAHEGKRELLGTTADRVLRTAKCPVWIARRPVRLPIVRFVVATDLSSAGQAALDAAAETIKAFGPSSKRMDVVLLHVVHPDLERVLLDQLERRLEDQAAGWAFRNQLADSVRVRPLLIKAKSPSAGLLSYLRRHKPDLLVIGTHGRGAIDRLLIGSVAARVLRACPCDALAVPPRATPAGTKGGKRAQSATDSTF